MGALMNDRLPIYEIEAEIISRLKSGRRLILSAPTGSGKSTQVPQMLFNHGLLGNGQVVILQPRRLAARLLASRVAGKLGVELGREVGYQVRFENCVSAATRIKFETEGILLRQLIQDPGLRGVQAIIFDGFMNAICMATSRWPALWTLGTAAAGFAHHRHVRDARCGLIGEVFKPVGRAVPARRGAIGHRAPTIVPFFLPKAACFQ